MERDGLAFPEALAQLAGRAGVELDERTKREDARNARLREVMEAAVAFYHAVLLKSKAGEPALAYLRDRGFTDETIERHQLGWAPAGWDTLVRQLASKRQVTAGELVEVGLASPRQRGGGAYDRFRERVIFPIRDQNGHAVGLGGRILGKEGEGGVDRGPKYLNSPATPLFDKSRTLYLIDRAKSAIRKGGQAVIVEGYTDALMAHQAGFDTVVASLGTALTPQQVALLTRYAKRIVLAYDVDPAGEKAGTLGVTALNDLIRQLQSDTSGVTLEDVRVARLPAGKDPDEVVREDPAAWETAIARAKPLVEYLIEHHAARFDLKTSSGRIGFVEAIMPAIRDIADPLRRDEALGEIHRASGIEERVLRQVLDRPARNPIAAGPGRPGSNGHDRDSRITADAVLASPDALPVRDILRAVTPVEAELLRLLLLVPDQQLRVVDELGPDQLPSTVARELFRALVLQRAPNDQGIHPPFDGAALLLIVDEETAALARALYAKPGPDPRMLEPSQIDYEITRLLIELEDDVLRERSDYNEAAQGEAERAGDAEAIDRLLLERRQINEARLSLDRR